MNNIYKRMFAVSLLIFIIALVSVKDAESGEEAKPDLSIGIKAVNERLIARDVLNVDPIWCGPGHILAYKVEGQGIFLQNIDTGEVKTVSDNAYNKMVGCTNDGKWFVYRDVDAYYEGDEKFPKYGHNIVRYEVATGDSEAFAIAYDAGGSAFSPSDNSIYLAGPHPESKSIEMVEPKWNIIWSGSESDGYVRLGKPSVVISGGVVYVLEPERWIFKFEVPGYNDFMPKLVDAQDRFYAMAHKGLETSYVRCSIDIEEESVECETVFEDVRDSKGFDTLSDGKSLLLSSSQDLCLRWMRVGSGKAYCITEHRRYVMGWNIAISSDESMVAFLAGSDQPDGFYLYIADLIKTE